MYLDIAGLTSQEEKGGGRRVEAARSPPSVGSPLRSRVRRETALGEEEEAEHAERAVPMEVARTPPMSPPNPPQENSGRELFPARQDPILPGVVHVE